MTGPIWEGCNNKGGRGGNPEREGIIRLIKSYKATPTCYNSWRAH